MIRLSLFIRIMKYSLSILSTLIVSHIGYAESFIPAQQPIFKTAQPKPNIMLVLDDSLSMNAIDQYVPEHFYGHGNPVCNKAFTPYAWIRERQENGEYVPWQGTKYIPWDDDLAEQNDGKIDGLTAPPAIERCARVPRIDMLNALTKQLIEKYQTSTYLGVSTLGDHPPYYAIGRGTATKPKEFKLIKVPISDFSGATENEMQRVHENLDEAFNLEAIKGNYTPISFAIYEAAKYFRGTSLLEKVSGGNIHTTLAPSFYTLPTPLRYRCQQNHIILMTDGAPTANVIFAPLEQDTRAHGGLFTTIYDDRNNVILEDGTMSNTHMLTRVDSDLSKTLWNLDLRFAKKVDENGQEKTVDNTGKRWDDLYSRPMPIHIHTISLAVDPTSLFLRNLTAPSGGLNLGSADKEGGSAELLASFDTIFADIIKNGSSTSAVSDRNNLDLSHFEYDKSGKVLPESIGGIRYDTTFNFMQRTGEIRAVTPYIADTILGDDGKKSYVIDKKVLWSTNDKIRPLQGRFRTLHPRYGDYPMTAGALSQSSKNFTIHHKHWLMYLPYSLTYIKQGLRPRLSGIGDIVNAEIKMFNKDVPYLNWQTLSPVMQHEMKKMLIQRTTHMPRNLVITGSNDGMIHFINAERGIKNKLYAGRRDTAYFPWFLAYRADEIMGKRYPASFVMDGKTNITDGKVGEDYYTSVGMTGMGGGGKAVVGYRLYGAKKYNIERNTLSTFTDRQVTPLFEIVNEGPERQRTAGFKNLGYSYSGFEFFNRASPINQTADQTAGQIVALFGNGYGTDVSSLYLIDGYTGKLLSEVILSKNGGGASTPSIIVEKDPNSHFQRLKTAYVGDFSGQLYKINFNHDLSAERITVLFRTNPEDYGQSAISVRPLLINDHGATWVYFGTGLAADIRYDRGPLSKKLHAIYAIKDSGDLAYLTDSDLTENKIMFDRSKHASSMALLTDNVTKNNNIKVVTHVSSGQHGWYLPLNLYGSASGERIIFDPRIDEKNNLLSISTFGIIEKEYFSSPVPGYEEEDPCVSDEVFGSILNLDLTTGKSHGSNNINYVGVIPGPIGGDGITLGPYNNGGSGLSKELIDTLKGITGDSESSYGDDEGAQCLTDNYGEIICKSPPRFADQPFLTSGRLYLKNI